MDNMYIPYERMGRNYGKAICRFQIFFLILQHHLTLLRAFGDLAFWQEELLKVLFKKEKL